MRRGVALAAALAAIVVLAVGLIVGILVPAAPPTPDDKGSNDGEGGDGSDGGGGTPGQHPLQPPPPSIAPPPPPPTPPPTSAPTIVPASIVACRLRADDESIRDLTRLPPGDASCDRRFCERGQTTAKSVAASGYSGGLVAVGTVQYNSLVENGSVTVYAPPRLQDEYDPSSAPPSSADPSSSPPRSWEAVARLVPADGRAAWFGWSVAAADGTIAVGRPTTCGLAYSNAVYVFRDDGPPGGTSAGAGVGGWREAAVLRARGADFGWSLAVARDRTIAAGAKDDGSGSVFVFRPAREGGDDGDGGGTDPADPPDEWIEEARVVPSDWTYIGNDNFGYSVALSNDGAFLIAGAPSAGGSDVANEGLAYVFRRDGADGAWVQEARLRPTTAGDGRRAMLFGWSVAVDVDDDGRPAAAVGAPGEDGKRGAVYLFARSDGGEWGREAKFFGAEFRDDFGRSVAFSSGGTGRRLFVGATQESKYGIGYVQVFTSPLGNDGGEATPWALSETLVPGDQEGYSKFGSSLAIGGNTAVIGAELGNRTDSSSSYGSAYITSAC